MSVVNSFHVTPSKEYSRTAVAPPLSGPATAVNVNWLEPTIRLENTGASGAVTAIELLGELYATVVPAALVRVIETLI